jgi:heat shock transcription factor 1
MLKSDKKRKNRVISKSPGTIPAFLLKTYEILENPAYSEIISWNKEGNAFIVKKINDFSEKILPKYFKHNNFASFVRQLNMYDFHKSRHENNENEFRHKMFKRGQKHLLADIKRKTSEGHQYHQMHQIVPHKDMEIEKFKKDYNYFIQETLGMKNRQQELENFTKAIFNQNNRLIQENKLLWTELIKNKEKSERKIEKLMLFIFSMLHANPKALGAFNAKKHLTNFPELSKIAGDPNAPDSKIDLAAAFQNSGIDQNVVSLLPDPKQFSGPEGENLMKKLQKMIHSGNNGEPEYSIEQLMEGLNKGKNPQNYENYLSYLEEYEKNNRNYANQLNGNANEGSQSEFMPQSSDYIAPEMEKKPSRRFTRTKKSRSRPTGHGHHMEQQPSGSEDDFGGEPRKSQKVEHSNVNMMDHMQNNGEYGIKGEMDHDYMNQGMMSSPMRPDYPNLNITIPKKETYGIKNEHYMQPIAPNLYNRNPMMMQPMQDQMQGDYNFDPNQVKYDPNMMGSYHNKQDAASNASPNPYKDFGEILQDVYQKPQDNKMNYSEKKGDIEDQGLNTPTLLKVNSALMSEPFSPALYMNNQHNQQGVNYLHGIEDLVNERN